MHGTEQLKESKGTSCLHGDLSCAAFGCDITVRKAVSTNELPLYNN